MDLVATFIQNQGELMILLTGLMFALIIIVIILITLARDRRLTAKELRHISEISHGLVRNQGDLSERIAADRLTYPAASSNHKAASVSASKN